MTITSVDVERLAKLPLGNEIVILLKPIFDNDEFIYSALLFCETQTDRQKLINEIKSKNITKYGDVIHTISEIRFGRI